MTLAEEEIVRFYTRLAALHMQSLLGDFFIFIEFEFYSRDLNKRTWNKPAWNYEYKYRL